MLETKVMVGSISAKIQPDIPQGEIPKIILVEDEIIVAMDIEQRLEVLGYNVVAHATSGEEALRYVDLENPDLILMDIKLNGEMDGIETAAKIRNTLNTPIIYLTAFADENTLKRARLTEAYGYLIKPFENRELHSTIEMALYKYKIEKKLRESEERYALAIRAANDGIWDWDLLSDKIYYSPRWASMLGLAPDLLSDLPREWLDRIHPDDQRQVMQALSAHLTGSTPTIECEYRIQHHDGSYRWMMCHGLALFDLKQKPYRMAGSQSDITDRKRFENELIRKALHDELTGLPNRALFVDRLHNILELNKRELKQQSAVIFLDIDNFKVVNDSFGHSWGDKLLVQIAQRFENCLRPGDTVSRFGGDEFAILLDHVGKGQIAYQIAERLQAELSKPFNINGGDIIVTASMGIMYLDDSYQYPEEVLRDADIAMYSAKNKGGACYDLFNVKMREHSLHRMGREIEIRRALEKQEFILYYQPIFSAANQRLVGFEALIRWQHPVRGLLLPEEFIAISEETKLIIPIGEWVLRTACAQAQAWKVLLNKSFKISVNLSRVQILDDNFISKVKDALRESGLAPELLELEITESVAMENVEITLECLKQLGQIGVTVAIDDFGSGYSSMDHLKRFHANTLKIDRSFINDLKENDLAIVNAMITMAHQLRLKTIAEGVETKNQLSILANMECDEVQGFYLGKPISPDKVLELFRKTSSGK
jgi:diguanylate cyclase (GGDEF)-like protein/PAS domain S-box-containing protein